MKKSHSSRKRGGEEVGQTFDELLSGDARSSEASAATAAEEGAIGMVIGLSSGRGRVFISGDEVDCLLPAALAVRQKSALAVGDRVRIGPHDDIWRVTEVLPRTSVLARPDPLRPHMHRLVAANIDAVILVVTFQSPPLRPRLIDRYLIAIERGRATPVICVNKIDLIEGEERASYLEALAPYRELGIQTVLCSARTGEGLETLRSVVRGKVVALVGHSGVGKSSLLNALNEQLRLDTGGLLKRGKGAHTTTSSALYDFGDGTYLIDTPGIREFGLAGLDRKSLRDYFPEFESPSESCRFNDCVHIHEPGCAVREEVEEGTIHPARYETYRRLYEDLS
ncbi:MAG TPA: ribosome small subunit-dependent GTPase A [Thermoanaerobaculia bacterium]|nr:ribosome small subunit-dependent GTPase A [Thermoanaerobaculia bacterium]